MAGMSSSRIVKHVYLFADAVILILCLLHIPSIMDRGHFPFALSERNGTVIITGIPLPHRAPHLSVGDTVVSVDGVLPRTTFELQLLADVKSKNIPSTVIVLREGQNHTALVDLSAYYPSMRFVLLTFFVGMVMLILSGMLIFSIPHEPLVVYLHNINVSLSAALMLTWGVFDGSVVSIVQVTLFFVSYILFGFVFFLFCRALWKPSSRFPRLYTIGVYATVILYAGWMAYLYVSTAVHISLEQFRIFTDFLFAFRLFVVLAVAAGMLMLVAALKEQSSPEQATRLRWIIGGILAGGIPYTVLGIIPVTFFGVDAIAEELSTLFFLLIPLCVSVAFIRYNLLNLRSFVRRQRIYTVLRMLISFCIIFIASVLAAHWRGIEQFDTYVTVALAAGIAVALLLPAGKRFEQYVDERLFETKLNYRKILKDAAAELHTSLDDKTLFHTLLTIIHSHLPVRTVLLYRVAGDSLRLIDTVGTADSAVEFRADTLHSIAQNPSPVVRLDNEKQLDIQHDYAVLIRNATGDIVAVIGLALEMRRDMLEDEDRDFLSTLATETNQMLERFRLQEEIILKKNEARRLKEMDAMKSFFVSSVSHDLRMPLTSIQMYTEMLRSNRTLSTRKQREFLKTILGETGRLKRHVENILNLNAIEQQRFRLECSSLDARRIVRRAVNAMQYEIQKHSARIRLSLARTPLLVSADETALERVVMNLISNALKYSPPKKRITISVRRLGTSAHIIVADNGVGIPKQEQAKIFAPFYRIEGNDGSTASTGMGIGLAVVQHIVEQLHGSISLRSGANKGTTMTVSLPLIS